MKSIKKILIIFIAILIISFTYLPKQTYAIDEIIDSGSNFISIGQSETTPIEEQALADTSSYIYGVLFAIGLVIAVAVGMIIGIQFITGSIDEKAKIKETLIPYFVGVFILFAAFSIWKIAIKIGNDVEQTKTQTEPIQGASNSSWTEVIQ